MSNGQQWGRRGEQAIRTENRTGNNTAKVCASEIFLKRKSYPRVTPRYLFSAPDWALFLEKEAERSVFSPVVRRESAVQCIFL